MGNIGGWIGIDGDCISRNQTASDEDDSARANYPATIATHGNCKDEQTVPTIANTLPVLSENRASGESARLLQSNLNENGQSG